MGSAGLHGANPGSRDARKIKMVRHFGAIFFFSKTAVNERSAAFASYHPANTTSGCTEIRDKSTRERKGEGGCRRGGAWGESNSSHSVCCLCAAEKKGKDETGV